MSKIRLINPYAGTQIIGLICKSADYVAVYNEVKGNNWVLDTSEGVLKIRFLIRLQNPYSDTYLKPP